jgi:hypothetical protein
MILANRAMINAYNSGIPGECDRRAAAVQRELGSTDDAFAFSAKLGLVRVTPSVELRWLHQFL